MTFIADPAAAFGAEAAAPGKTYLNVLAANAVAVNELVALSTSPGYVIRNLVATSAGLQVGVALAAAAAGKALAICTGGWCTVLKGTGALTVGNLVGPDATVSGAVNVITNGFVTTTAAETRGWVGTVVASATAAATTVNIFFGKF